MFLNVVSGCSNPTLATILSAFATLPKNAYKIMLCEIWDLAFLYKKW